MVLITTFHPLGYLLERSRSACGYNYRQKHQHKIYMHDAHVQQVEWLLKPLVLTSDHGFPYDVADT